MRIRRRTFEKEASQCLAKSVSRYNEQLALYRLPGLNQLDADPLRGAEYAPYERETYGASLPAASLPKAEGRCASSRWGTRRDRIRASIDVVSHEQESTRGAVGYVLSGGRKTPPSTWQEARTLFSLSRMRAGVAFASANTISCRLHRSRDLQFCSNYVLLIVDDNFHP